MLGDRGQQEPDDVPLPHAQLGQPHRSLVGQGVELRVAQRQPLVGDEGRGRPEAAGRLGRGLGQHANRPTADDDRRGPGADARRHGLRHGRVTRGAGRARARPRCCAGSPTCRRRWCRRTSAGTAPPRRRRRRSPSRSRRHRSGSKRARSHSVNRLGPGPSRSRPSRPSASCASRQARCSASLLKSLSTRCSGDISPRVALAKPR